MSLPHPTGRVSIHVYNAILERSRATGADLAALLILASFADDGGYIRGVSNERLMLLLRMETDRGVQILLNRLVKAGELDKKPGVGAGGVNAYEILCLSWPAQAPELPFGTNASSGVNANSGVNAESDGGERQFRGDERQFGEGVNASSPKEQKQKPDTKQKTEQKWEGGEKRASARSPSPSNKMGIKTPDKNPATQILELHAEMWTAASNSLADGFPLLAKFEKENNPQAYQLLNQAVTHVGGYLTFKTFRERPRNASFVRKEFLEYLRNNDPEYERAVTETAEESMAGAGRQVFGEKPTAEPR